MSYSPVTSDDDSIRALLRRLDADPLHEVSPRPDPLRDLREARMKVAARARAARAEPEGISAGEAGGDFGGEVRRAAPWDDTDVHAIVLPPVNSAGDETKRRAGSGQLMVINDVPVAASRSWRGRLLILGAGLAVCSVLAATLGPGLSSEPVALDVGPSSPEAHAMPVDAGAQEVHAQASPAEGLGRFTIAAVSFAEARPTDSQDPAVAETNQPKFQSPAPLAADTLPRLDISAGDHVALPIELSPAQGTGEIGAIVLRGLPAGYNVVAAMPGGDDSWVLSPDGFAAARIVVPAGGAGEVHVTAELFDMSAQSVGSPSFILDVKPTEVVRDLDPQRARALLARGQALLQAGDIAGARLLFELAAESGVAEGAYALGETFDPIQLGARGAVGLTGDAARARFWYEYASERGIVAARERLAVLQART